MRRRSIIVLLVLVALSLSSCKQIREYRRIIDEIEIEDVDLQRVDDGQYTAEVDAILVRARVGVTVKEHRITAVDLLEYEHGRGEDAEVLPAQVLEQQSLKVDTITGATSSSKVILEAIELALKKGIPE